jgi:hypothetical protein
MRSLDVPGYIFRKAAQASGAVTIKFDLADQLIISADQANCHLVSLTCDINRKAATSLRHPLVSNPSSLALHLHCTSV